MVGEHHETVNFSIDSIRLNSAEFSTSPELGTKENGQVETKAHISNKTTPLGNDRHAVSLTVNIKRLHGEHELFECEVCYIGVFLIQGLSDERGHELLMTRCLDSLYPYVSATISQLAVMAGFHNLQMVPLNFGALYHTEQREKKLWDSIQDKVVRH